MTFSYSLNNNGRFEHLGTKKMVTGTFAKTTGAGDGRINVNLKRIELCEIQMISDGNTAPTIAYPKIASLPTEQEGVTIRVAENTKGTFKIIGE